MYQIYTTIAPVFLDKIFVQIETDSDRNWWAIASSSRSYRQLI